MAYKFFNKGIRKFNEQRVIERTMTFFNNYTNKYDIIKRYATPTDNETEVFSLMVENASTQGVNVKLLIGETIIVELPWLASEGDVRLCYAFLNAIKKVHRTARVLDENEKSIKLTDCDAEELWNLRCKNMEDIINKGERITFAGVNRDFYLNPLSYLHIDSKEKSTITAFEDFIALQWTYLNAKDVMEEKRHITDDEELCSIRVVDNTNDVFIGASQYVGMMKRNTCKMVKFEDFCQLMDGEYGFRRMDAAQALLDKIDEDRWNELFDKAEGIVLDNFRKTLIMRWNTDISNHKMADFEDSMENFYEEGFYYDWSIWDFQKVHIGDKFYMIRTGNGVNGVVMKGTLTGTPYVDEDWSGKGRMVYYVRMALSHLIHPNKAALVLTTKELSKAIPDFNWQEGHSGELLTDDQANQLDLLWEKYLKRIHKLRDKRKGNPAFSKSFKEKAG